MSESILRLRSMFPDGNARESHHHNDTLSPMWFYIPFSYNALKLVRLVGCVALALGYKPSLWLLLGWALTDGMFLYGRGVPRIIRLMFGMYDVLNMILILAFFADWSLSSTVQFGKFYDERRTPEEELTTSTNEGSSPAPWLYSMLRIHARCTLAVVAYTTLTHSQLSLSAPRRKAFNTNQKSGSRANETTTDPLLSPYLFRLRQLIESYLQHEMDMAQHRMIEELASELAYSQPGDIEICLNVCSTWIDAMKCFVEDSTLESWDWWPFHPPSRPPIAGYSCIRWLCLCGKTRWANVPDALATQLVAMVKNAAHSSEPAETSRGILFNPAGSSTTATQAGTSSSIPLQEVSQGRFTTTESGGPRAGIINANPGAIPMPVTSRFVLFMAKIFVIANNFQRLFLTQIESHSLCDDQFFRRLRLAYWKQRGRLRNIFGLWSFSHCDFYRFQRFTKNRFAEVGMEMPPTSSGSDYFYLPRSTLPPISKEEFNDRFYSGYFSDFKHMVSFNEPRDMSCVYSCRTTHAVDLIPQKTSVLAAYDDSREDFWGIVAREKRSVLMYGIYFFISLCPCIIFFFVWIFSWGHDGDLQNASVPMFMSFTLLATLGLGHYTS